LTASSEMSADANAVANAAAPAEGSAVASTGTNPGGVYVKLPKGADVDAAALKAAFTQFGEVVRSSRVNKHSGSAQVFFKDAPGPAQAAIEAGSVSIADGIEVQVRQLNEKKPRQRKPKADNADTADAENASKSANSDAKNDAANTSKSASNDSKASKKGTTKVENGTKNATAKKAADGKSEAKNGVTKSKNAGQRKKSAGKVNEEQKGSSEETEARAAVDAEEEEKNRAALDARSIYARLSGARTSKPEVTKAFETYGEVKRVEVRSRRLRTGEVTHIFITFADVQGAEAVIKAVEADTKIMLGENELKVDRRKRKPTAAADATTTAATGETNAADKKAPRAKKQQQPKKKQQAEGANNDSAAAEEQKEDAVEGKQKAKKEKQANGKAKTEGKAPAPKTSVYITNIAISTDEDSLRSKFSEFGAIKSISRRQRESFATVAFADAAGVEATLAAAKDGKLKLGEDKVLSATSWRPSGRSNGTKAKAETETTAPVENAVHVTGFGYDVPSEDAVKEIFTPLGAVSSVTVQPTRCFGIVQFEDADVAASVVEKAPKEIGLEPENPEVPIVVELSVGTTSANRNRGIYRRRNNSRRVRGAKAEGGAAPAAETPASAGEQ